MAGWRAAPRIFLPVVAMLAALVLASPGSAAPARRWSDTAVVESTIQEVYARPPADLLLAASNHGHASAQQAGRTKHAKGGGNKHGKGYHHKHSAKGNDGYKHYDAFHTKSNDKYGYENHSSFGKKKKGGKNEKYGSAHDAGFAGSHPDVEVVQHATAAKLGPRSQFLQDMSGDASVDHESAKYRRGLHDDDMFFVFSADGNENQDDGGEGQQQQQQADDDDHDDDDGEAAEQQEAADDDDEDDDGQRQKQQQEAEDDYDY